MIEHVKTTGFKGFDLDEKIPQKALYVGKNKSGKSTRSAAVALAVYGYIPFMDHRKKNDEILDDFGVGDSMSVAAKINGVEFERRFSRAKSGTVSQLLYVDQKKINKTGFEVALGKTGKPVIVDVQEFMKQSTQKKVETLFSLFPVDADLMSIDSDIENVKAEISEYDRQIDGKKAVIQQLTESKSSLQVPAGSLAEVQKEIEEKLRLAKDLENQIKQAEIAEAEERAKKQAITEAKKTHEQSEFNFGRQTDSDDALRYGMCGIDPGHHDGDKSAEFEYNPGEFAINEFDADNCDTNNDIEYHQERFEKDLGVDTQSMAIASIERIIDAMKSSGCSTCAAMIIAKVELKKYNGGVA